MNSDYLFAQKNPTTHTLLRMFKEIKIDENPPKAEKFLHYSP